jgi:hypothetical protein
VRCGSLFECPSRTSVYFITVFHNKLSIM